MAEFFSHPVPAAVVLLGLLVLIHELGHFLVGKKCGIAVEVFSIGFGPRLFNVRRGDTDYRVSWIPLGGYVKFYGSGHGEEVPQHLIGKEWTSASVGKRVAVAVAGPIANFILAVIAYTFLAQQGIPFAKAELGDVMEGSPAERAGLLYGDVVKSIGEHKVSSWKDLETAIFTSPGKSMMVVVNRHGVEQQFTLEPEAIEKADMLGKNVKGGRAGIARGSFPAVISVVAADSPAAKAGMNNGDLLTEVRFGDQVRAVNAAPEIGLAFHDAKVAGAKEVKLVVQAAPLPRSDSDSAAAASKGEIRGPATTREISLAVESSWVNINPAASDFNQKQLLTALGLDYGQLVIGFGEGAVADSLKRGDKILSINGKTLRNFYDLREALIANQAPKITMQIQRDFKPVDLEVPMEAKEVQGPTGRITTYSFPFAVFGQPKEPALEIAHFDGILPSLGYGFAETGRQTVTLVETLGRLVTGDVPLKALGGPILIAKVAGDSVKHGWQAFLTVMAVISINLGVINLFPIPVLDGGQLVMFGIEALRRKPLSELAIENFQKVGFVLIMSLVVVATYNDISRFWKSMLSSVTGMFQ